MKALKLESQQPRDKILREERIPAALMFLAGAWLIAAPWAIGYPAEGHRDQARANDVIAGIVVAFFAVVAVTIAIRRRRAHEED